MELRSEPASATERVFMTSGTTGQAKGMSSRGRHFHPALDVYDLSMTRNFAQRFMAGQERMPMGILFPDEQAMPNSSLAHYLALAKTEFGTPDSRYFLTPEGLDMPGLCTVLEASERSGRPYALLGASFSLVHVMDALRAQGRSFRLPPGSRILDTGGYKGQSRELPLEDFYAGLTQLLGVPRSHCINMYGMTELSTQFYDDGNAALDTLAPGRARHGPQRRTRRARHPRALRPGQLQRGHHHPHRGRGPVGGRWFSVAGPPQDRKRPPRGAAATRSGQAWGRFPAAGACRGRGGQGLFAGGR
jgi:hypothetical protein